MPDLKLNKPKTCHRDLVQPRAVKPRSDGRRELNSKAGHQWSSLPRSFICVTMLVSSIEDASQQLFSNTVLRS